MTIGRPHRPRTPSLRRIAIAIAIPISVSLITSGSVACGDLLGIPPEPTQETPDADRAIDAGIVPIDAAAGDSTLDASAEAAIDGAIDARSDTPSDASIDASIDSNVDPIAQCDSDRLAIWKTTPPSMGLAKVETALAYDSVILGYMKKYQIPGGAVAVTIDGRLVFAKGYGFADADNYEFAHPDSLFRVAGLSKQITSTAIMMLVQTGKLSLTDSAFGILKDIQPLPGQTVSPALASITVRDLLRHSAGWNSEVEHDPVFQSDVIGKATGVVPPDCNAMIRYELGKTPTYAPGTVVDYSNFGYCVLGAIVEKITGSDYATWVKNNILIPAKASERILVGHTLPAQRAEDEVTYYDYAGSNEVVSVIPGTPPYVPDPYGGFYLEGMRADSAWIADPVDFLRFQTALDGIGAGTTPLLNDTSLAAIALNPGLPIGQSNGTTKPADPNHWLGLGWQISSSGVWSHFGSLAGTTTIQMRGPSGDAGVSGGAARIGWAAFFNSRPNAIFFESDLDDALWNAFKATTAFTASDWFDQFALPFSPWEGDAAYTQRYSVQAGQSSYPVRTEGKLEGGVRMYRSRFAYLPSPGFSAIGEHGIDCLAFVRDDMSFVHQGAHLTSLQSFVDETGHRSYQATWANGSD